jgi:enolase
MKISEISLKIIQDSRGENTLEATMSFGNLSVISSVPAGKSKGKFETVSVDPQIALQKFEGIKSEILNADFSSLLEFDNFLIKLDGTSDKSNLGGNLILVLSIGFTKLFAKFNNLPTYRLIAQILGKTPTKFPSLFINLIGGGLHAKDSVPFQEQTLVTHFNSPNKSLEYAKLLDEKLRVDIEKNFGGIMMGDEGTFSIKSSNPELGLEVMNRNLDNQEVSLALDVAASTFYVNETYRIGKEEFSTQQMLDLYKSLCDKFPLLKDIEDPFAEDDKNGFVQICEMLADKACIIGDDLTVTNKNIMQKAIDEKQITGVIIKPNQIGSVSETFEAIKLAQNSSLKIIVAHRSGETNDDFIADLAFGAQADGLKAGAPTQPQRLAKYNRLIEIEREVNR